jgi:hypothetical protein
MELLFLSAGKYRDGRNLFEVTPKDIEDKKVFTVSEDRAKGLIEAKRSAEFGKKTIVSEEPATLEDVKKMTVPELKAYAEKKTIDLGEAKVKDEIFAVIEKTFEEK